LELLKETSDPIEAWKLPKRFYLKLFFVIGLLTEIQQSTVRAAEGSSSGGGFLPPNLSYLSYEDSRKRSLKLEILSVKSSFVIM